MSNLFYDYDVKPSSCCECEKPLQNTYEVITPATGLVVELDIVKAYLRIDGTDDDALLTLLIQNATLIAEKFTRREFLNKGFRTYRDSFGRCIELEKSKLQSVENVKYIDVNNVEQTLDPSDYSITNESLYSRIYPAFEKEFPVSRHQGYQNVIIEFTAGYGDASTDIPADIKQAILLMVSDLYANRGDCCSCTNADGSVTITPSSAKAILDQYRIIGIC